MDDNQIVDLYWERSETAISETAKKYGRYCHYIAFNVLRNDEDSEECVSDTYLNAWNSMPPHRPSVFKTFLGKLTRNISLNKYKQLTAEKRGNGQMPLIIDELHECLPTTESTESITDDIVLVDVFNCFLAALSVEQRKIFMRRYWYMSSIKEIATDYGMGESKVKMSLLRSRNELKCLLEKEGITI
jgi:RNA polymerase sigma-70 factor (ECF subfamily)